MKNSEILIIFVGLSLKYMLMNYCGNFMSRLESITYSSADNWHSILNAKAMKQIGVNPFEGDTIHQTPLLLEFWLSMESVFEQHIYIFFLLIDFLTSCSLINLANSFVAKTSSSSSSSSSSSAASSSASSKHFTRVLLPLISNKRDLQELRLVMLAFFNFNPYLILSSASFSLTCLNNLLIVNSFRYIRSNRLVSAGLAAALLTHISLWPGLFLIGPILLQSIAHADNETSNVQSKSSASSKKLSNQKNANQSVPIVRLALILTIFCGALLLLTAASKVLDPSCRFLSNVYLHHLTFEDTTPHFSLYWYMFVEMFQHFNAMFSVFFQAFLFLMVILVCLKMHFDPDFVALQILCITAAFRSYPSIGELGIVFAIMPFWLRHFRAILDRMWLGGFMLACALVLGPIMHHLWIHAGSANANFFFAISLLHLFAQVFIFSDLFVARLRWPYYVRDVKTAMMTEQFCLEYPRLSDGTKLEMYLLK